LTRHIKIESAPEQRTDLSTLKWGQSTTPTRKHTDTHTHTHPSLTPDPPPTLTRFHPELLHGEMMCTILCYVLIPLCFFISSVLCSHFLVEEGKAYIRARVKQDIPIKSSSCDFVLLITSPFLFSFGHGPEKRPRGEEEKESCITRSPQWHRYRKHLEGKVVGASFFQLLFFSSY
jgi:hypothetical protein